MCMRSGPQEQYTIGQFLVHFYHSRVYKGGQGDETRPNIGLSVTVQMVSEQHAIVAIAKMA